jgi:hypothetical protein
MSVAVNASPDRHIRRIHGSGRKPVPTTTAWHPAYEEQIMNYVAERLLPLPRSY